MAESGIALLPTDIVEQILARMDVKDLMRYKMVCKSWLYLISYDSAFIKTHMINSYNKDRNNNEIESRRIVMAWIPTGLSSLQRENGGCGCYILGSSNGLVCLITPEVDQLFVVNPSTREIKKLPMPPVIVPDTTLLCGGFGYDLSTDDYKLILGFRKSDEDNDHNTCFQVLSLKSDVWKVIEVEYKFYSRVGVLCDGALHWFIYNNNNKVVLVSFDLSSEKFKEIPQPDDSRYQWHKYDRLGIIDECLSIYNVDLLPDNIWMMKKYNVKQSWKLLPNDFDFKYYVVHALCEPLNVKVPNESERSFVQSTWTFETQQFMCTSIFVQSLVSPHALVKADNEEEP